MRIDSIPEGLVIDIGGGGEGIIAQIGKDRITAIEKRQSEIDEAKPNAPTANWVLADATDLPYADEHFDNATTFFSGMYMTMETFEKICKEILRVLKKKMQREGVFREMKQRRSYEKPSERKNREKSEAVRRARKQARKKAQRDGLIPPTRKKNLLDGKKVGQRPAYVVPRD